jgi:hypothetical protein
MLKNSEFNKLARRVNFREAGVDAGLEEFITYRGKEKQGI